MPNILVRDVPEDVLQTLKRRAASHRRSLQQELLEVLQQAADQPPAMTTADVASAIRERLTKAGMTFPDSTPLIREDRER